MRGAAVIPVGPANTELERLKDLSESIRAWVPDEAVVVVDDCDTPRSIDSEIGGAIVLRPPGPRALHPHDNQTATSLTALDWLAASRFDYFVKLDTDALVIGDYRPSLHSAISEHPEVGMWGAYTENQAGGSQRDFTYFKWMLRHACLPVRPRRGGILGARLETAILGDSRRARRFLTDAIRAARRRGYQLGEHCLGGSYALTRDAAQRMRAAGYLNDPRATTGLRLSEDVIVSLLAIASGSVLRSLVASGEAFAVKHRGLLAPPAELEAGGHSVIHSLKNDPNMTESEVRAFFRARRSQLKLSERRTG